MDISGRQSKSSATSYSDFYKGSSRTPGSSLSNSIGSNSNDNISSTDDEQENKRMAAIRRRLKAKRGVK
jgi:hypothetical protein